MTAAALTRLAAGIIIAAAAAMPVEARKVVTTRPVKAEAKSPATTPAVGIDTIATDNSALRVAGYDKPLRSRREAMFVTSLLQDTIYGAVVTLTYTDMQGRTLHERTATLPVLLPPGATRRVDIPSWDRQMSFYYCRGAVPRRAAASAFDVTVRVKAILRPSRPSISTSTNPGSFATPASSTLSDAIQ